MNQVEKITFRYAISKLVPFIMKAAPKRIVFFLAFSILHGLSFAGITVFMQQFIDKATTYSNQRMGYYEAVNALLVLGLAYLFNKVVSGSFGLVYRSTGRYIQGKLGYWLNQKMGRMEPIYYEDTNHLDTIQKAKDGMINSVWFTMTFLLSFSFYLPYLIYLGTFLFLQKPILCVAILLAFGSMIIAQILRAKVFGKLVDETAPLKRKCDYFSTCITDREYFKETRVLGAFHYFNRQYKINLKKQNQLQWKATRKANCFDLIMQLITILCYVIILVILLLSVIHRDITLGAFTAIYYSLDRLFGLVKEFICDNIGYLMQDLGSIIYYLRFMEIKDFDGIDLDTKDFDIKETVEIEFQHVSFRYPQSTTDAIHNISFHIRPKETIAIVGVNGSGKSTLIRLMTGIYQPTDGDVLINGENTKNLSMKSRILNTSGVFQKFSKYQMTLQDNLIISDLKKKMTKQEMDTILAKSGLNKNESFTLDYDTMLSREFGGIDLSGGQWQKIAIARGYYRDHEFIILDEPTAAIDPVEETRLYHQFADICTDKTAVIVTHRLGSAKIADRILVMDHGDIVESGDHETLLQKNGTYAKLYHTQQQWYA